MTFNNTSPTVFLAETVSRISNELTDNKNMQISFNALIDSIMHTAPEIVNGRWKDLFLICSQNINDESNPAHQKCLKIYNSRYEEYRKIYN